MINFDLASEIQKLADNTNFRVLKAIKRYKLNTSTDEGVLIDIARVGELDYRITFDFRISLKMQDINTGRGWKLGQKINQLEYEAAIDNKKTRRRPRRLVNRKIFWFINSLRDTGTMNIVEETINSFTVNITTPNAKFTREN